MTLQSTEAISIGNVAIELGHGARKTATFDEATKRAQQSAVPPP